MIKKERQSQSSVEITDAAPHSSYQHLIPLLENLSEEDLKLVERYLNNLKERKRPTSTINQRTKAPALKSKRQVKKQQRTLADEIKLARDKLLSDRLAASKGGKE